MQSAYDKYKNPNEISNNGYDWFCNILYEFC